MSTTNAAMMQQGDTTSTRQRKENQKYQEMLAWESRHISPYIPQLEPMSGYRNDFSLPELYNSEIINSFSPFITSYINPIRDNSNAYSEVTNDKQLDDQARYAMDQFRQFLMRNARPELASEPAILNMKYRSRIETVLSEYKKGMLHKIPQPTLKDTLIFDDPDYERPKNAPLGSLAPKAKQKPIAEPTSKTTRSGVLLPNADFDTASTISNRNTQTNAAMKSTGNFAQFKQKSNRSIPTNSNNNNNNNLNTSSNSEEKSNSEANPPKQLDYAQLEIERKQLNSKLCFNYDKMLVTEGKIVVTSDGESWNNRSHEYNLKLAEWQGSHDAYIQESLKEFKGAVQPFFLRPRIFREIRPIDRVKHELIQMADGQRVPFESVSDRRSVELMHQRDYLVYPQYIPRSESEFEQVNEVFMYDRSFVVEQNPVAKNEILHEYPTYLTPDELYDFLYSTGLEVNSLEYYKPVPNLALLQLQNKIQTQPHLTIPFNPLHNKSNNPSSSNIQNSNSEQTGNLTMQKQSSLKKNPLLNRQVSFGQKLRNEE